MLGGASVAHWISLGIAAAAANRGLILQCGGAAKHAGQRGSDGGTNQRIAGAAGRPAGVRRGTPH